MKRLVAIILFLSVSLVYGELDCPADSSYHTDNRTMFGVLGFLPGYIIAKILHAAGKLRISREVELAGLDYNIMESAKKDEKAVSSASR